MSLKQEIETWVQALEHYDSNEFDDALQAFMTIADTSKILFNCGVIQATLGEHHQAVQCFQKAVHFDQYLAVAYFQQGVSNFLLGDFEEALANFNDTLLYLRGNKWIDYHQLGLKFKLHSCEALFNRGLCYIYLQQKNAGLQDLSFASKEKAVPDHDVIDEAIREQAEGYTVFSIPVGTVYRPNEAKVRNIKSKNYLGISKLIAAHDPANRVYSDHRRNHTATSFAVDDRPGEHLSYAATNLVRPGLSSRSRQQSEPPLHRNLFPPTPPPEADRPAPSITRRKSSDSTATANSAAGMHASRPLGSKPAKLDLGAAAFDHSTNSSSSTSVEKQRTSGERPRIGTTRSASERPRTRKSHVALDLSDRPLGTEAIITGFRGTQNDTAVLHPDTYHAPSEMQEVGRGPPMHHHHHHQRNRSGGSSIRRQHVAIVEEDEPHLEAPRHSIAHSTHSTHSSTVLAYEITAAVPSSQLPRPPSPPAVRRIRMKVHAADTRYVMLSPDVSYEGFVEQIRKKLGLQEAQGWKIKMRDEEGDMVTLGDEEDLELLVATAREVAGREGAEMGKMEVWVQES